MRSNFQFPLAGSVVAGSGMKQPPIVVLVFQFPLAGSGMVYKMPTRRKRRNLSIPSCGIRLKQAGGRAGRLTCFLSIPSCGISSILFLGRGGQGIKNFQFPLAGSEYMTRLRPLAANRRPFNSLLRDQFDCGRVLEPNTILSIPSCGIRIMNCILWF